jgi:carbamoyl-phosphate synthase small subunit
VRPLSSSQSAYLLLEDGRVFSGSSLGLEGLALGEVVFNTSMTGYQEILTDPSYSGQLVTMTYPLIGNYGVNKEDEESERPEVAGFIVREASRMFSSWRGTGGLHGYLADNQIVGISGVDTRALTLHIRSEGAMRGAIAVGSAPQDEVMEKIR